MEIKVLGSGCVKCRGLDHRVRKAVAELSLNARVEKIENLTEIMHFGVTRTPALVVDNKVVMSGQLPTYSQLKELLLNL
ncbi:thioredoxin family protein [Sunxiuqinia indica]|uniref:thioredoxin family protein n=1 Tax=Sunxiuqinia indica TaxID=2692584 RepID=UPI0013593566|nr:thioredoxin family protein [Sunxiuqinia indica]